MRSGPYRLWTINGDGYIQAGRIVGGVIVSIRRAASTQ